MVTRTITPPDASGYFRRTAPLQDRAQGDRPRRPSALVRYLTTAALPLASAYPGCMAFNVALGVPVISDGAHWYPVTVGAAIT